MFVLWKVLHILDIRHVPATIMPLHPHQPIDQLRDSLVISRHAEFHEYRQRYAVVEGGRNHVCRWAIYIAFIILPREEHIQSVVDISLV